MKSFHIFPLALVGAALTTPLAAQAPTRKVIHAGHLLAEPGKPARGASPIIVEDGRILSIAEGHKAAGPAPALHDLKDKSVRSEERRVGKECVRKFIARWGT